MKFVINCEVIQKAFAKVDSSKVISGNVAIPILNAILLEVTMDEISLTASNSHDTIRHCIPVDGESVQVIEPGKTVLPKDILGSVKKLKTNVEFTLDGYDLLIVSGKKEFSFICLDAEEYPRFPEFSSTTPTLRVSGEDFKRLITKTAYAASTSETRPILQGVNIQVSDGNCRMVCTDSHRLAKVDYPTSSTGEIAITVPAKGLDSASKVFDLKHDVEFFVENQQFILMKNETTMYLARLLDGNYPDTSRLIPNDYKAVMVVNREAFFDAIDSLTNLAKTNDNNNQGTVKLHVNGVATFTTTQSQRGKGKISVPYESLDGPDDFVITFSCKYALDALKAMEDEFVSFHYQGDMRPFVMKPSETSSVNEMQLILPVRTY